MTNEKDIIALYVRTETKNMKEVRQQEDELLAKFNTENNLIYDVYIDNGVSSASDKPEYNRLLLDMKQNKFSTIVVYSLDRFGRSFDALEYFMRHFNRCNCRLMTIEDNIDILSQNKMSTTSE